MANVFQFVRGINAGTAEEYLFKMLSKQAKPNSVDFTMHTAEQISEELPQFFSQLTNSLKKPTIKIRGKFNGNSNIAGISIQSGNKPVENLVMSLSEDSAVLQLKRQVFDKKGKTFSESFLGDTRFLADECTDTFRRKTNGKLSIAAQKGKSARYDATLRLDAQDSKHILTPEALDERLIKLENQEEFDKILKKIEYGNQQEIVQLTPQECIDKLAEIKHKLNTVAGEMVLYDMKRNGLPLDSIYHPDTGLKIAEESQRLSLINKNLLKQQKRYSAQLKSYQHHTELMEAAENRVAQYKIPQLSARERQIQTGLKEIASRGDDPLRQATVAARMISARIKLGGAVDVRLVGNALTDAGFSPITGDIIVTKDMLKMLTPSQLNAMIRHEMAHAEDFIKLYKAIGSERYKELISSKYGPQAVKEFSRNINQWNWDALSEGVSIKGFDAKKYEQAFKEYDLCDMAKYYTNPFETRAYQVEAQTSESLAWHYHLVKYYQEIRAKMPNTEEINKEFDAIKYRFMQRGLIPKDASEMQELRISNLTVLEELLQKVEKAV